MAVSCLYAELPNMYEFKRMSTQEREAITY
jgi:hypothetical protein